MVSFYAQISNDCLCLYTKTLLIFSISHDLGLTERGKSLVFSSTVLKRWNHHCATLSLMTPSPPILHILGAAVAAL